MRILKNSGLSLLFLVMSISSFAQEINISGKVIDGKTQQPLEKVLVKVVHSDDKRIIFFTQTDKSGMFIIKKEIDLLNHKLEFSHIAYASQEKEIKQNENILIELVEEITKIKEVIVNPSKIIQQKDTIRYQVSAFAAASDRTIGDVLKKMPGIEVSESGEIKYQGQQINKFYIEGSDLLGGRYGLASNNISHKDVSGVEVMENHQPIKMLEDLVPSFDPAINIKLKEDAKSRWAGTLKGGCGITELWNAEVFAMRFKKATQSLNTYKGSNIGSTSNDTYNFFEGRSSTGALPSYIHVAPSSASGIGNNRNRFEVKNSITTNNLLKIGKDYELLPEFVFLNSHRSSEFSSSTTYYLADDVVITEDRSEDAYSFEKKMDGKIELRTNQKRHYFSNVLKFNLSLIDIGMDVHGTHPNTQEANIKNKEISNNFNLMKRFGDHTIKLQSVNEIKTKPQYLIFTKNGESPVSQDIDLSSFYSKTSLQYGFVIGKVYLDMEGAVLYKHCKMENTLDNQGNMSTTEDITLTLNPSLRYKTDFCSVSLNLPVFYKRLSVINKSNDFSRVNPSMSFNWFASPKTNFVLSGSYSTIMPDENLFYEGVILSNYRNKNNGYIDFATGNTFSISAGIKYKNVLNLFFADASATFLNTKQNKIQDQIIANDFIYNSYVPGLVQTNNLMLNASVSKGLKWIDGTIYFTPSAIFRELTLSRNGLKIPYNTTSYNIKGRINSKVVTWCNLTYDFFAGVNTFKIKGGVKSSYNRFSETLTMDFYLLKSLQLKFLLEHYYNEVSNNEHKNFLFPDISASYLYNRWEFSLQARNIFDEKYYSYTIENDLSTNNYNYRIRPRDMLLSVTYRF